MAPTPPADEAGAPRLGTLRAAPRLEALRIGARVVWKVRGGGAARRVRVAVPGRFRRAQCFFFGEPVAAPGRPVEVRAAVVGAPRPRPLAAVRRAAEAAPPHGGPRGKGERGRRAHPPAGALRGAPPPLRTRGRVTDGGPLGARRLGGRRRRAPRRRGEFEARIGRHAIENSWRWCGERSAPPVIASLVRTVLTRGLWVRNAQGRLYGTPTVAALSCG